MARLHDDGIRDWLAVEDIPALARMALKDLQACRAILHDLHARMVDVYDGSDGSRNELPFTGGDIRDIEEVLR